MNVWSFLAVAFVASLPYAERVVFNAIGAWREQRVTEVRDQ